jgi:hypothetical protein
MIKADLGIESLSVYDGVLNVYRIEFPFDALNIILVNLCKSFANMIPEIFTNLSCEKLALSRLIYLSSLLLPLKIYLALKRRYL